MRFYPFCTHPSLTKEALNRRYLNIISNLNPLCNYSAMELPARISLIFH